MKQIHTPRGQDFHPVICKGSAPFVFTYGDQRPKEGLQYFIALYFHLIYVLL